MNKELESFLQIYKNRPITTNNGGMKSPSLFALYQCLTRVNPAFVIESGVWRGQGTWFIESLFPQAGILSIDPNLSNRLYTSTKALYSTSDLLTHNSLIFPPATIFVKDDHQDLLPRLKWCRRAGVSHIFDEDNYSPGTGDHRNYQCLTREERDSIGPHTYNVYRPIVTLPMDRHKRPWSSLPPVVPNPQDLPRPIRELLLAEALSYTYPCYIHLL